MSTSATTDPSAAQIGKIIEEAEEGLPLWLESLDHEQQARLTVELMLLDSSGDPIAFAKRSFRCDSVIVVGFVLHGGKPVLSTEENRFIRTLVDCALETVPPTDCAVKDLLNALLEKGRPDILSVPRLAGVLPQWDETYSHMRAALFALANLAIKLDGDITEAEKQSLNWMADVLPDKVVLRATENAESMNPKDIQIYDRKTDGLAKPVVHCELDPVQDMLKAVEEIKALVGLLPVKEELQKFVNLVRVSKAREKQGLERVVTSMHMVFTGNPGTGKTTVARLVGRILRGLGMLAKGHLIEVDRSQLVAEYVGQTAGKTLESCNKALGGILFIDEAYALAGGGDKDYGRESIETLLKFMEDHRDCMAVIVAGYTGRMREFIDENPGLQSRFNRYVEFPDYDPDELTLILERQVASKNYILEPAARTLAKRIFEESSKTRSEKFGNARMVRNFFERAISIQADRLANCEKELTKEQLLTITAEDLPVSDFAPGLDVHKGGVEASGDASMPDIRLT